MRRARCGTASLTAALLAIVLLAFASVQSIVMQATMASPDAGALMCGGAGAPGSMSMGMEAPDAGVFQHAAIARPEHRSTKPDGHRTVCPYCAAANHAPVAGQGQPLLPSVSCVFAAYRLAPSLGPRGPPSLRPRARDPPSNPLTA